MSIISIQRIEVGQVGIKPGRVKILSTDNLATVTAAGYLNGANLQGITIGPLDVIEMMYGYNASSGTATWSDFTVAVSGGIITLSAAVSPGDVLLPVVSGDYAIFNGTSGQIKDSAQASSNAANPFVVSSPGTLTVNHIAQIADVNGSIKDGGVLGTAASKAASDATKANVASITAATVSGQLAQFNDTAGTIGDSGVLTTAIQLSANIKANAVSWGGGSASHGFTITGLTTASIVIPAIQAQATGTVYIESYTVTSNTLTVTFSADPGAMVLQYVAFIAPQ